eukprot:COSAG02_NODE_3089_length_7389_cov_85.781481_4_plen_149_part_00
MHSTRSAASRRDSKRAPAPCTDNLGWAHCSVKQGRRSTTHTMAWWSRSRSTRSTRCPVPRPRPNARCEAPTTRAGGAVSMRLHQCPGCAGVTQLIPSTRNSTWWCAAYLAAHQVGGMLDRALALDEPPHLLTVVARMRLSHGVNPAST